MVFVFADASSLSNFHSESQLLDPTSSNSMGAATTLLYLAALLRYSRSRESQERSTAAAHQRAR